MYVSKKKNVLMLGGLGTIGKILTYGLPMKKYNLVISDKIPEVEQQNNNYIKIDVTNFDELIESIPKNIDVIINLIAIPEQDDIVDTKTMNEMVDLYIKGVYNVFLASANLGIKRVIFASSNHVTGAYEGFPPVLHKQTNPPRITVNDSVRPDSDYGSSKAFGEIIARQYFELYGIKSICLRIGRVLRDDDPTKNERAMKMWLSHRDLIELIKRSIFSDIKFQFS